MIDVGESSGALAPMLTSVAEFYEDEVALRLAALVSIIEPAILVFMSALVAFILVSLYLPIFSFSASGVAGLGISANTRQPKPLAGVTPAAGAASRPRAGLRLPPSDRQRFIDTSRHAALPAQLPSQ